MVLPTGTVTFLFTDIEGSTSLWEAHPRAMRWAARRHDSILKQEVLANHGVVFKHTGDGICAAFGAPSEAIAAAFDAQRALLVEPWGEIGGLRVRMGVHTGEVEQEDGDYAGTALNLVSRLMSAAHGGQTVLSNGTIALAGQNMPQNVSFVDLGEYQLRGLVDPQRIFQLIHPTLPANFPPLRLVGATVGNLPVELTSFVGRDNEIRTVGELLSAARLVTLAGIGGAGKTRLALKVADEQQEAYPDGAWLVQLASLTDPALVDREVAATIGPTDREKRLLLVLNSCEHLLEACAQTAMRLLQEAPLIRILATSREPLGVPGEVIYRVPPLSIPSSTDLSPDLLSTYEAVTFFVDRARSVQPNFMLTTATGQAVSQIVRRLDGIPLGLELAAARINVLSVDEIAKRLDDMFRLLRGGSRTALPQQRTLEATIEWSYRLLPRSEQLLFNRLSVFRGGFTLEAAEQVAADPDQDTDVLELLSQLVSKSVVTVEQKEDRPTRYRLLETLRQYGWDRLRESDETTDRRDRHTRFFMELAQGVATKMQSAKSVGSLTSLKNDHDNLRVAVEWALESNNPEFVGSESMGSLISLLFSF